MFLLFRKPVLAPRSENAPLDAAFARLGTNCNCVLAIGMRQYKAAIAARTSTAPPCSLHHRSCSLHHRSSLVSCVAPLKSSDTFPGHSMVVGKDLAAVPSCGAFDSSVL